MKIKKLSLLLVAILSLGFVCQGAFAADETAQVTRTVGFQPPLVAGTEVPVENILNSNNNIDVTMYLGMDGETVLATLYEVGSGLEKSYAWSYDQFNVDEGLDTCFCRANNIKVIDISGNVVEEY